jgi:AraC-like DNA-binding protein
VTNGAFGPDDVASLKTRLLRFSWERSRDAAQAALNDLFGSLWHRFSGPLPIAQLAYDIGCTPNYLSDLVREHTGRSIGAWISEMRMARARALLEQTDLPIADVGERCGYQDPGYFARAFRRMHGVSPLAWRVAAHPRHARHAEITLTFEVFLKLDTTHLNPKYSGA